MCIRDRIYSELAETTNKIVKNLEDYRFDEAAKNAYQFTWHSYCDWYLELSKTILNSNNKNNIKETKEIASYIFKEILVLLHPFIPFITEEIWLKNKLDNSNKDYLMYSNWVTGKPKKEKFADVENIIDFITEIRSFKNELSISPGSYVDISLGGISNKNKSFFVKNNTVIKRLGRITNFIDKDQNKPSASLVIKGSVFKLYFEQNVDLNLIKENLLSKQTKYQAEMDKISSRLKNKDFVKRAPKHIVDQEKSNYNNLENDIKKISTTVKNL